MERLNAELTKTMKSLVEMEKRGEDVPDYIFDVIQGTKGTARDYQYLLELADLGYLAIGVDGTTTVAEGITSKGLSYFADLEASEKREQKKIWSDRRFQLGLSVGTLILSGVISFIVSLSVSLLT